jgi:hypothetical protein
MSLVQLRTILAGTTRKVGGYGQNFHLIDILTHNLDFPPVAVRTHAAVSFMSVLAPITKSFDSVVVKEMAHLTSADLGGTPIDVALSPFSLNAGLISSDDSVFRVDWKEMRDV